MPIRRSQKKRNAEPRPKQNQRRLVIDPMVNPGRSAHRHQARSKAHPTRTHHRMVTLAQSSPGDRSAFAPQSKTATVMLDRKRGRGAFRELARRLFKEGPRVRQPAPGVQKFALWVFNLSSCINGTIIL